MNNKPVGMYPHKYDWASSNQQSGDCSIWIRVAQLEFDDGIWECQVTASDFHTQDALTSQPVRLAVRVPPQRPKVEFNGSLVLPGQNLTTFNGKVAVVKCISRYGNPPPRLKWLLDNHEVIPSHPQINTSEPDNKKTWLAISTLELSIAKEDNGKPLSCVAVHDSYPTKTSATEVRLDVMYVPETILEGIPNYDVEDLKDTIAIKCIVKANPPAAVVWTKEGQTQPARLQELLKFSPTIKEHSGVYTCIARNKAGESKPLKAKVDVKYRPKVISVGKDRVKTATLHSPVSFECQAEGNPPPTYQWIQTKTIGNTNIRVIRGRESKFYISNVSYDLQGEWRCEVVNVIKGKEQSDISEPLILQVHGAPQVLRQSVTPEISVETSRNVDLSMVICADPRPRSVIWEWESNRLESGRQNGRFIVDDLKQEVGEDCYLSTLHIQDTTYTDTRTYYLIVENDNGKDTHSIQLIVNDPIEIANLIGVTVALIIAFIVMVCACVYAIRTEKCCQSCQPKAAFPTTTIN